MMDILKVFAGMVLVGAVGIVGTFYTMKLSDWVRACLWERKRRKAREEAEQIAEAIGARLRAAGFRAQVVTLDRFRDHWMETVREEIGELCQDIEEGRA